jgi:hypothetical protein
MLGLQTAQARKLAEDLSAQFPSSDFPVLVRASLLYREKNYKACSELLAVCGTAGIFCVEIPL